MGYTIKDVARQAGVGVATVSRVINRSGYVREETRQTVMEAVRQLNYSPNVIARSLSRSRSDTIVVIIPDITNPFFSEAIRGITSALEATPYTLVFHNTNEDTDIELRVLKSLPGHRIAGLIIAPEREDNPPAAECIRRLQDSGVPVLLLDRNINEVCCDRVFIDNTGGAQAAVSCLLDAGHRRIAVIHGPIDTTPGRERLQGWEDAYKRIGLEPDPALRFGGDFSFRSGWEQTGHILASKLGITAIFSCNNVMTLGCIRRLHEEKLAIPGDMSLFGFDNVEGFFDGGISCVSRPSTEMGHRAVEILLTRIEEHRNSYTQSQDRLVVMDTQLSVRGSEWLCGKKN